MAAPATAANNRAAATKLTASVVDTSNKAGSSASPRGSANPTPAPSPATTVTSMSRMTMRTKAAPSAPRAIRIPSSAERRVTASDETA